MNEACNILKTILHEHPEHEKVLQLSFKAAIAVFQGIAHLVHSLDKHLVVDAGRQLIEAKFLNEELDQIIDEEIFPNLKIFETEFNGGGRKACCSSKDEILEAFDKAIKILKGERKNFQKRMIHSNAWGTRNKYLKLLTVGVGATGVSFGVSKTAAATYLASCTTFPLSLATGPAFPLIVGLVITSGIGYRLFGENQSTYEQAMEVLRLVNEKALNAENRLKKAKEHINRGCRGYYFGIQVSDSFFYCFGIVILLICFAFFMNTHLQYF